ncbi:hypothetical protein [Vampirovibrio chlorellavorus]|uniref:hypothetical protein n=1 Tax=Vampirovibrio chlorellavorus TaxID=758823 RepID=UPI0026F26C69|nr:hypothetical protein [Vampirovibrio chlorellavorus]
MSQTFAGSYTNLFSQSLLRAVMQMAMTNPQAAAISSPMVNMMDISLAQSVLSVDGMLSSVGVSLSAGIPTPQTPVFGGIGVIA